MPPVAVFLGSWHVDPTAVVVLLLALGLYGWGVVAARRRGVGWPAHRTAGFVVAGLGSYALVCFGFLGTYSAELRWAFTTRVALLLLVIPGLTLIGRPLGLAHAALGPRAAGLDRVLNARPVRLLGNAIVAPIFACALFLVFLTPLAGAWRLSTGAEAVTDVVIPALGLFFVLPIVAHSGLRTEVFIAAEFLFAFLELVIDSVPGLLLRLSDQVLDGVAAVRGAVPGWFPRPLTDQHWSGDLLWAIAEVGDLPILIALFVRWARADRRRANALDELSDDELAELARAHLDRGGR